MHLYIILGLLFTCFFIIGIQAFAALFFREYLLLVENKSAVRIMLWTTALIAAVLLCCLAVLCYREGHAQTAAYLGVGVVAWLFIASRYSKHW